MDRTEFVGTLQRRLATPGQENLPHPLRTVDSIPSVRYPKCLDDPAEAFLEAASALGATVRRITRAELGPLLEAIVREEKVLVAVVSRDPETAGVEDLLRALPVEVKSFDGYTSASAADLGITGAAWAIAATGSVVLDAGRAGGRSASLLCRVHLALIESDRILKESGELFRSLEVRMPYGLPSQLVLASGPSRSADIELTVTIGVHGPARVWIAVLDPEEG